MIDEINDEDPRQGLGELEALLGAGFFLKLVAQLQRRYTNVGSGDVEDAVATAAEKISKRLGHGPVRDVRAYLAKAAYNECDKAWKRRARRVEIDIDDESVREQRAPEQTPEEAVLQDVAVALIKQELHTWENAHIREVMFVYIDVLVSGDVLEAVEIAEIVSQNLGEEISVGSVSGWKARGLRKLLASVESGEIFEDRDAEEEL